MRKMAIRQRGVAVCTGPSRKNGKETEKEKNADNARLLSLRSVSTVNFTMLGELE
jgi:hypothetical protein